MLSITMLLVFFGVSIGVGIWGMRRTSTLNDFFLGGRSLGPWMSAIAFGTTYFSAVLFIGFAGKQGWEMGLYSLWISAGNVVIGALLAWLVLGRRTRRMTQNLDVMTMPEFFEERFGTRYLKFAASLIIFVFLLPYTASVFKGLGHLFETHFHIPYNMALLLMVGVTGIYLILGGYLAIALNDFIQGIVMIGGAVLMIIILQGRASEIAGGNVIATIISNYDAHIPEAKQPSFLLMASLVFMTSFGTWGMPQMVQKFYSIKNEKLIFKAAIVTTLFSTIIVFAAYYTGALTHIFFTPETLPSAAGKPIFDRIIPDLLNTHLPQPMMSLILLLILSASMSTLAGLILVSASAIAIDLYKGHVNPKVSKEKSLLIMRFLSGLFIVVAYFIALNPFSIIVTLMSLSWGAVAGTFMAPFIYGLFWKQTTRLGAEIGGTCGLITSVGLFFLWGPSKSPMAASCGMLVPFIVVPLVSLFTKPPSKEIVEKAFR